MESKNRLQNSKDFFANGRFYVSNFEAYDIRVNIYANSNSESNTKWILMLNQISFEDCFSEKYVQPHKLPILN